MGDETNASVLQKNNVKSKESLLLDVTFRRVLENTVNLVSEETFCDLYRHVCNNRKSVIMKLHNAFKNTVVKNALEELNTLVGDENIDVAMKQLAAVVERTRTDNTDVWRPPGDVHEHLRSFDVQEKLKRKRKLEGWVVAREADTARKRQKLEQAVTALVSQESRTLPRLERLRGEVSCLRKCLRDCEECLSDCLGISSVLSLLPDTP